MDKIQFQDTCEINESQIESIGLKISQEIDRNLEQAHQNFVDPMFQELGAILSGKRPPSERKLEAKKAIYFEAFLNFMSVYSESELGNLEVDIKRVALFINSPDFVHKLSYEFNNIDDCYKIIEEDVLSGLPVWRFLKCDKRLLFILERDLAEDVKAYEEKLKNDYICKRCLDLEELDTSLGFLCRCKSQARRNRSRLTREGPFDYTKVKTCKYLRENEDGEYNDVGKNFRTRSRR